MRNIFGDVDEEESKPPQPRKKLFKPPVEESPSETIDEDVNYMNFKVEEPIVDIVEDKINHSLFEDSTKSIGLSIMEKMGFKVGDSLGVNSNAIKEPILIPQRINRLGIAVTEQDNRYTPEKVTKLKQKFVQQSKAQIEIKEIRKIMKLCLEMSGEYDDYLEHNRIDKVNALWRPYLIELESKRQIHKFSTIQEKSKNVSISLVDQIEDLQGQLHSLLEYLRNNHSYCWYCGIKFNSEKDLQTNCPGIYRDVHFKS